MRKLLAVLMLLMLTLPVYARGRSGSRAGGSRSHSSRSYSGKSHSNAGPKAHRPHSSAKCIGCARDSHGRIKRSAAARDAFKRSHPCPSTGRSSGACPGYVIDHIKPLKRGGADDPTNMQWQTTAAAKAKDRVE
jgi:hypothetical protein